MRSMIGVRVKVLNNNRELVGMVSSIKDEKIKITINQNEEVYAPLFDCEVSNASEEELKNGIELVITW